MINTPEQARELVAQALESGEYTQGYGQLERNTPEGCTNCCLGVACRQFEKHEGTVYAYREEDDANTCFEKEVTKLPYRVQQWLGFSNASGGYDTGYLTEDNDGDVVRNPDKGLKLDENNQLVYAGGKSFTEIAELFRNPPEGLLE